MTNELIFILTVLLYLGSVLVLYKIFGKNGLYAFAIFGTLLGNIAVCKCVDIFGLSTTAGNVLYAATFLVTDIRKIRKERSIQSCGLQFHDHGTVAGRNAVDPPVHAECQ